MTRRISVSDFQTKKDRGQKITMVTSYGYSFAKIVDACGMDSILVGDSVANVVMGAKTTKDVTVEQMIYHAAAVNRGVSQSLVVADLPFCAVHSGIDKAVEAAHRLIGVGCDAVKIEWFDGCLEMIDQLRREDIAVMGHVGLTPQTAEETGGFKVRGKTAEAAYEIYQRAWDQQEHGCFSIVLECVPDRVASVITKQLKVPTIGIGAGAGCDGQVLVLDDLLGLFEDYHPKFAKQYAQFARDAKRALTAYVKDVQTASFPAKEHSFIIEDEAFQGFLSRIKKA